MQRNFRRIYHIQCVKKQIHCIWRLRNLDANINITLQGKVIENVNSETHLGDLFQCDVGIKRTISNATADIHLFEAELADVMPTRVVTFCIIYNLSAIAHCNLLPLIRQVTPLHKRFMTFVYQTYHSKKPLVSVVYTVDKIDRLENYSCTIIELSNFKLLSTT